MKSSKLPAIIAVCFQMAFATCLFGQQPIGPKVKGLSIGMNFEEALKTLSERIAGKNAGFPSNGPYELQGPFASPDEGPLADYAPMMKQIGLTGPYAVVMPGMPVGGVIRADNNNSVVFISFTGPLTKALFEQAANLDFQAFAQEFTNAYGVQLDHSADGENLEAQLDDGVLVVLQQDFTLRLEKTKSSEEVKSAFD